MKKRYDEPTPEEVELATQNKTKWVKVFHGGVFNHWKLVSTDKKGCGCRKKI